MPTFSIIQLRDKTRAVASVLRLVAEGWPQSLRLRGSAMRETLIFLAVLLAFDLVFGAGARFYAVSPHPFWIIVLLTTVQYGPREGLFAALMSGLVLVSGDLPEQSLSESMYSYILRVFLSPLLWVVTALALGGIRARQIDERDRLREQLDLSHQASAAITDSYKSIKLSKERLETRLAEERRSILAVYEEAKLLETLEPIDAETGIQRLIASALNPIKYSLFTLDQRGLTLTTAQGWDKSGEFASTFDAQSPLSHAVIDETRVLSVAQSADEATLAGQGILAGPIIDDRTGRIFGMLKIEEIGFTDMDIHTHEIFRTICAWIGHVYGNIETHRNAVAAAKRSKDA